MSLNNPGALGSFGWSDRVLALFNDLIEEPDLPARIVRVQRSTCAAVFADGTERNLQARPLPAVGDWVTVRGDSLRTELPRWSCLSRADPSGDSVQVLAANMDLVIIAAPADRLSPARVERELAVSWDSGAQPLVVLTKSDLAPAGQSRRLVERLVGVDVLETSTTTGEGLEELHQRLRPCQTAVLLGPSGAGKSTLANALIGTDRLSTGAVRAGDSRGRHTTTSRQMVPVPGGGVLIDTPGLRSLGLTEDVEVGRAFPEIEALAAQCRFDDCRHGVEPGCAVNAAVADGRLGPARLASYLKLEREADADARRMDPQARKAQLEMWKARTKAGRLEAKRKRT